MCWKACARRRVFEICRAGFIPPLKVSGGVNPALPCCFAIQMSSIAANSALWFLVKGTPHVDPHELLAAMEQELEHPPHDFRTRLLIRDSYRVLERFWGSTKLTSLCARINLKLEPILQEDLGEPGFPSLEQRIMEATKPELILQFLRELGDSIIAPARLDIGGASALILGGYLSRATDDVDIVDEVPANIRFQHELLAKLTKSHGLSLTHFQSHYLPHEWQKRVRSLGKFGKLDVYLIDVYDVFVGKLFSKREKDRDDLRLLSRSLDRQQIAERLNSSGSALAAEPGLREQLEKNWYILFGDRPPK
jgi:hypothetical protein